MRKLLIAAVAVMISCISFSQNNTSKIVDVYGQEAYNEMQSTNPGMLELLDKYVDWGLEVVSSNEKYDQATLLQSIPLRSKSAESITVSEFINAYNSPNFNPLQFELFPSNEIQVYKLSGTNYALLIQTQNSILAK